MSYYGDDYEPWEINYGGEPFNGLKIVLIFILFLCFIGAICSTIVSCDYPYNYNYESNSYERLDCHDYCDNTCETCWKYMYDINRCVSSCVMECKYLMCHVYNDTAECQALFSEVCTDP